MTKLQEQALRKGTQIAVYEIRDVLGINQSEFIYRAWNEHLNANVIIKEFFPFDYVVRDETSQTVRENSKKDVPVVEFGLKNFNTENEKLLGVQHPGVQSAHNVLSFNQTAYLAVEDEKGTLLSEQLEKLNSFNEDQCRMILTSLLNTVINYNLADIIHGDIYPGNILIKANEKPTLINFAGAWHGFAEHVKMLPFQLHTGFAAPEQYQKDQPNDISSDLFAIGATIYRCITQSNPVDSRDRIAALAAQKPDPQKSALDHAPSGFSKELLELIDWMLQPDTKSRPHAPEEVLTELNKENKNSVALQDAYPAKIEKASATKIDSEPGKEKLGLPLILSGMMGSVLIGSLVLWFLQNNDINSNSISGSSDQVVKLTKEEIKHSSEQIVASNDEVETEASLILDQEQDVSTDKEADSDQKIVADNVNVISASEDLVEKNTLSQSEQTLSENPDLPETTESKDTKELVEVSEVSVEQASKPDAELKPGKVDEVTQMASEKSDLINLHMTKAQENFAAIQLTTPIENNAYLHYKAVLMLDPTHEDAKKGIQKIVDFYLILIDKAIAREDYKFAQIYLNRAKSISPKTLYINEKTEQLIRLQDIAPNLNE